MKDDSDKTRAQLLEEIQELRRRVIELEGTTPSGTATQDETLTFPEMGEHPETLVKILLRELRDSKDALVGSLTRYNELVNRSRSIILEWDTNGNILFMNKWGLELFGFSDEELIGQNVVGTIVPPVDARGEDLALKMGHIQVAPDEYYSNENENIRKNGERVWISWTNRGIYDAYGRLIKILSVGIDRTSFHQNELDRMQERNRELQCMLASRDHELKERKLAEGKLRAVEVSQRALIDAVNDSLFMITPEGTVTVANVAHARKLNLTVESLIGKNTYDLHPGGVAERRKALVRQVVELGEPIIVEDKRGGRTIENRLYPVRNEAGKITHIAICGRDITDRRRADAALRESERRYSQIVNFANEGIMTLDSAGNLTYVNPKMAEIFGYAPGWMIGKPIERFLFPEDLEDHRKKVERRKKGISEKYERRFRRRDGSALWVLISATAQLDKARRLIGSFAMLSDITDRKLAEATLSETKMLLEAVVNSTGDMIWSVDPEHFGIQWFNQSFHDYFLEERGMRIEIGMRPEDLFPSDNNGRPWREMYQRALREGRYTTDYFVYAKISTLQLTFNLLKRDGQVRGISVFGRDISSERLAEKALRDSEERFRGLSENSLVGIYTVLDGRFAYVNPALADMFGYEPEELLGANPLVVIHPDDHQLVDENSRRRVTGEVKNLRYTFRGLRKNGEIIYAEALDGSAELYGRHAIIGNTLDVTARKRAEDALVEYQDRLRSLAAELSAAEERERARLASYLHDDVGQFLALAKIKLSELLTLPISDDARELAKDARNSTMSALERTRTITADLFPLTLHQFGLSAALEVLAEEFERTARFAITFHSGEVPYQLDMETSTVVYRCCREALHNVVKHAQAKRVYLSMLCVEDKFEVVVEDDGVGFDFEEVQARNGEARGFGLFSIGERLRYIGGQLTIDSAVGRGTRVILNMPCPL